MIEELQEDPTPLTCKEMLDRDRHKLLPGQIEWLEKMGDALIPRAIPLTVDGLLRQRRHAMSPEDIAKLERMDGNTLVDGGFEIIGMKDFGPCGSEDK